MLSPRQIFEDNIRPAELMLRVYRLLEHDTPKTDGEMVQALRALVKADADEGLLLIYNEIFLGLISTALLEFIALWYPPLGKEDTDGRACQSGRAAGVARVFGGLSGSLSAAGRPRSAGALHHRAAHRAAQQELRYPRPGSPRHQRTALAGVPHEHAVGRGGPQPPTGAEDDRRGDPGRRGAGAGRYRVSQAGEGLGRGGAAVLGHAGQGGQLPDRGDLLLHRSAGHLAGSGTVVLAEDLGTRPRASAGGACAGGDRLPDQTGDRPGPPRSSPDMGGAASVCRGRCRLWGQPQLSGGLGGA